MINPEYYTYSAPDISAGKVYKTPDIYKSLLEAKSKNNLLLNTLPQEISNQLSFNVLDKDKENYDRIINGFNDRVNNLVESYRTSGRTPENTHDLYELSRDINKSLVNGELDLMRSKWAAWQAWQQNNSEQAAKQPSLYTEMAFTTKKALENVTNKDDIPSVISDNLIAFPDFTDKELIKSYTDKLYEDEQVNGKFIESSLALTSEQAAMKINGIIREIDGGWLQQQFDYDLSTTNKMPCSIDENGNLVIDPNNPYAEIAQKLYVELTSKRIREIKVDKNSKNNNPVTTSTLYDKGVKRRVYDPSSGQYKEVSADKITDTSFEVVDVEFEYPWKDFISLTQQSDDGETYRLTKQFILNQLDDMIENDATQIKNSHGIFKGENISYGNAYRLLEDLLRANGTDFVTAIAKDIDAKDGNYKYINRFIKDITSNKKWKKTKEWKDDKYNTNVEYKIDAVPNISMIRQYHYHFGGGRELWYIKYNGNTYELDNFRNVLLQAAKKYASNYNSRFGFANNNKDRLKYKTSAYYWGMTDATLDDISKISSTFYDNKDWQYVDGGNVSEDIKKLKIEGFIFGTLDSPITLIFRDKDNNTKYLKCVNNAEEKLQTVQKYYEDNDKFIDYNPIGLVSGDSKNGIIKKDMLPENLSYMMNTPGLMDFTTMANTAAIFAPAGQVTYLNLGNDIINQKVGKNFGDIDTQIDLAIDKTGGKLSYYFVERKYERVYDPKNKKYNIIYSSDVIGDASTFFEQYNFLMNPTIDNGEKIYSYDKINNEPLNVKKSDLISSGSDLDYWIDWYLYNNSEGKDKRKPFYNDMEEAQQDVPYRLSTKSGKILYDIRKSRINNEPQYLLDTYISRNNMSIIETTNIGLDDIIKNIEENKIKDGDVFEIGKNQKAMLITNQEKAVQGGQWNLWVYYERCSDDRKTLHERSIIPFSVFLKNYVKNKKVTVNIY